MRASAMMARHDLRRGSGASAIIPPPDIDP